MYSSAKLRRFFWDSFFEGGGLGEVPPVNKKLAVLLSMDIQSNMEFIRLIPVNWDTDILADKAAASNQKLSKSHNLFLTFCSN